jgi:hypothetical protein
MSTRRIVTASAAALAVVALSVPVAGAQDDIPGPGSGSSDAGSLDAGSLDAGSLGAGSLQDGSLGGESLAGGSLDSGSGEGDDDEVGSSEGGSLDSGSAEDSSLGDLAPESEATCELPDLGGSVAKFYPLFGISGIPSGVLDLVTSALGSFPNLLDVVAGPGGGAALVGQAGSLTDPLCTSIFGGEMVLPPVTVIVDGDGNPVTTVTGTVAPAGSAPVSTSGSTTNSTPATDGDDTGSAQSVDPGAATGTVALPTSVPTPGA